ncbi:MAG: 5-formyltetrahydrofolate cyclo-ligase [Bacillota bacterium]|jgi:5-formyltetrahydrofolate cyclo-ligase|nr:5-formyltetrahydrofolate cyclo-ligase [Bacillota bacterium]
MVPFQRQEIKNPSRVSIVLERYYVKGLVELTKTEIRSYIKRIRNQIPISLRQEYNHKIYQCLFSSSEFNKCSCLFTYISFGSEIDTIPIIDRAFRMNKRVYVPRVENKDMNFYEIHSLDGLVRSKFGILEPDGNMANQFVMNSSKENMLMILPGLAFDRSGNRIGYGAGYYDGYLGSHPHMEWTKLALAYEFQIVEPFKPNMYDIPTDFIITPNEFIIC